MRKAGEAIESEKNAAKVDERVQEKVDLDGEITIGAKKEKEQIISYFTNEENQRNDYELIQRWLNYDMAAKIPAMSSLSDKITNKFILFKLLDDNFYGFYDSNNFTTSELTKNLTLFKSIKGVYDFSINFHVKEKYGNFRKFVHLFIYYYLYLLRINNYNIDNLKAAQAVAKANEGEKFKYMYCHSGKFLFSDEDYLGYFYVIIYILSNTDGFGLFREHLKENYIAIFKPFKESLINHYEDLYKYKLKFDEDNQRLFYWVSITTIIFGLISLLLGTLNVILIIKLPGTDSHHDHHGHHNH